MNQAKRIEITVAAASDVGAPVFTLEGRLAGVLTSSDGEPVLVPADVVMASVDRLLREGPPPAGDIGVVTQAVDGAIAAATGVSSGAAVAAVSAGGPADRVVMPGDVITAVNGQLVRSPEALRLRVARTAPGADEVCDGVVAHSSNPELCRKPLPSGTGTLRWAQIAAKRSIVRRRTRNPSADRRDRRHAGMDGRQARRIESGIIG